jgi:hypothetical protein
MFFGQGLKELTMFLNFTKLFRTILAPEPVFQPKPNPVYPNPTSILTWSGKVPVMADGDPNSRNVKPRRGTNFFLYGDEAPRTAKQFFHHYGVT